MALWTPAEITTAAWLDASDASTITESAGAVSQLDDKSGNANHATQATSSKQPTTGVDTIGGLNVIGFDGSGDVLSANGIAAAMGSGKWHFYLVGTKPTSSGSGIRFIRVVQSSGSATRFYVDKGSSTVNFTWGSTPDYSNITLADGTDFLISAERGTSDLSESFLDGTSDGTLTPTYSAAYGTMSIGSDGSSHTDLKFAELVVIADEQTSTERELMEGYLAHKWGLEGNLPGGHTYKSAAPTVGGIITDLAGIGGGLVGIGGGLVG